MGTDTAGSGGATRYATSSAATVTYKPAVGTNRIAIVMPTGPAAGKASITVNGGTATTVDLYSATAAQRKIVLVSANLSPIAAHTVVVKPLGTKNAASTSTRIDIDAFVTRK